MAEKWQAIHGLSLMRKTRTRTGQQQTASHSRFSGSVATTKLVYAAHTAIHSINFFKLNERARYDEESDEVPCSGEEAFQRYATVSVPTLEKVGGHFLLRAAFQSDLIGDAEDWDVVAVGTYPDLEAVLALFEERPLREIVAELGISRSTAKRRLYVGARLYRTRLEERLGTHAPRGSAR